MALAIDVENRTVESAAQAVLGWLFAVAVELAAWAAAMWRREQRLQVEPASLGG